MSTPEPVQIPEDLRYTETHEWARDKGGLVEVGITAHAAHEVSDVVFVDLPKPGRPVQGKKSCAALESVKAAFEIFAPVAGVVAEVNAELASKPQIVNDDPYGRGWMFRIKPSSPAEFGKLMDAAAYRALTGGS